MTTEFILDLTQYRETMGANVPEGRYTVVVDDCQMDKSKAGNPMINMWYRISDGEQKDLILTDRLTLTEKSLFRVVGFMQAIGLPTPKKRLKINLSQFIGKVLDVDVADGEPYNGRVKTEVKGYMRPVKSASPSAVVNELPEEEEDAWAPEEPAEEFVEETVPQEETPTPVATRAPAESLEVDLDAIDLG